MIPSRAAGGDLERLVVDLGSALHRQGASTPRVEDALEQLAERFDLRAHFFVTPTALFASFGEGHGRTQLVRLRPAGVDLDKLTRLDALLVGLLRGRVSPADARPALEAIVARRGGRRERLGRFVGQVAAAGAAARLAGGGGREVGVAAAIGVLCATLAWAGARRPRLGRVQLPLAAFLAAIVTHAAAAAWAPVGVHATLVGGLVVLLPGLALTVAVNELSTGHLASGTARFAGSLVEFLTLGFGVALGSRVAAAFAPQSAAASPLALPAWTLGVAVVAAPLAMAGLFHAPRRDVAWIVGGAVLTWAAGAAGQAGLGREVGAVVGGMAAGIFANGFARWRDRPSALLYVPSLLMLVPGTIGFRSVTALLGDRTATGIDAAFAVLLTSAALVTGMLLAAAIVPPRRAL